MPKNAQYVRYNDGGTWVYALVVGEGVGGPGNLELETKHPNEGSWQHQSNVPKGEDSGHWSD